MNGRGRVAAIVPGRPVDRCAHWTGKPHTETSPSLYDYFGCETPEEVYRKLSDDVCWIPIAQQTLHVVESALQRPGPGKFDLTPRLDDENRAAGYYRLSGNLNMYFHNSYSKSFRRMQDCSVGIYTHPEAVHAVTRPTNDYSLRLNQRFFGLARDPMEAFELSHDFGSQRSTMLTPAMFVEFVLPYHREQIDLGHEYGYCVCSHCCGAMRKVLPRLLELGISLLHSIQALAAGMDAEPRAELSG